MARKPKPEPDPKAKPAGDKAQIERFRETARQLGADETGEAFERAFAKMVPPKRPKPHSSEGDA